MFCTAFLSILLAGYTSGVLGLVLSTVLIVVFAEIIPQVRLLLVPMSFQACLERPANHMTIEAGCRRPSALAMGSCLEPTRCG